MNTSIALVRQHINPNKQIIERVGRGIALIVHKTLKQIIKSLE